MKKKYNNKIDEKNIEDYINFLEEMYNLRLYPFQREFLKRLCKQEKDYKIMPYFIRPRQSGMKFFYETLKQFYGIEYHTELIKLDINKLYGDEIDG